MGSLDKFTPKQFTPSSDTESVLQEAIAAEKARREAEETTVNSKLGVETNSQAPETSLEGVHEPGTMETEALKSQTGAPDFQLGADIELVPKEDSEPASLAETPLNAALEQDQNFSEQTAGLDGDAERGDEKDDSVAQQESEKKDPLVIEETEAEIREKLNALEDGGDFSSSEHVELQRRLVDAHNRAKEKAAASKKIEIETRSGVNELGERNPEQKKEVKELISAGENLLQELLLNKKTFEGKGDVSSENYKKIVERLAKTENGLKELKEQQQREAMEAFIAGADKVDSVEEKEFNSEDVEVSQTNVNVIPDSEVADDNKVEDVIPEKVVVSDISDENKIDSVDNVTIQDDIDNLDVPEVKDVVVTTGGEQVSNEPEEEIVEMSEVAPNTFEVKGGAEASAEGSSLESEAAVELSETELKNEANLWHGKFVDAQRVFQKKKNEMGLLKGVWQKLGGLGLSEGEKEELNQLKIEFEEAKTLLKRTELEFQKKYREYSQFVVNKKKQELVKKKKEELERDNEWKDDPEKIEKYLESMPKQKFFVDEIKKFVLSGEAVSVAKQEGDAEEGTEKKISLLQDMNEKIMEVDRARMEALSERDLNFLQKGLGHTLDLYKSVPRKYKVAVGALLAGGLAAGTAVAGGATAGLAISVGAFSGGRRVLASLVGGVVGAKAFKISQENQGTRRAERKEKSELKMAKEYAEGEKEVDLYSLLQNRLKQEKMDNYKSLAFAGAAGFVAGAGTRGAFGLMDHFAGVPHNGTGVNLNDKAGGNIAEGVARNEALSVDPDIAKDWEEIFSGKGEIPPAYGHLAVFDSFRDFVEDHGGNLDSSSKDVLKQWEEYSKAVPEAAKSSRNFQFFDRYFKEYQTLSDSPKQADRAFGHIERLLRGSKDEFELRVHGAELAEKMKVKYDAWAEDPDARTQAGVVIEVGGHKVPLGLLSEEDRLKVESARKFSEMNQPLEQGGSAGGGVEEKPSVEAEKAVPKAEDVKLENIDAKLLEMKIPIASEEWFAVKEIPTKDFLAIMKIEDNEEMLESLRKEVGSLPGRAGKLAVLLDKSSVANLRQTAGILEGIKAKGVELGELSNNDFATKAVIENISGKQITGVAGVPDEILDRDDGEMAGDKKDVASQSGVKDNRSWQEKVASKKMSMTEVPDSELKKTVADWKMKRESGDMPSLAEDREYKKALRALNYRTKSGVSIPDPEESPVVNPEMKTENPDDSVKINVTEGDFEAPLAKGDSLWDAIKKGNGGNEMEAAKTFISFKESVAEILANEYQLTPKVAQEYVMWRLKNLEAGDVVSVKGGEMNVEGFVDEEHIDKFLNKGESPKVMMA